MSWCSDPDMPSATLIAQQLNESPSDLVSRVDTLLQGLGPIGLQTLLVTRRVDAPGPRFTISLVFTTPGPVSLRAAAFIGTPTSSATAQLNAFMAGLPAARAHFIRDISDQRRGSLSIDALMLIYAETTAPNCGYDRSSMIVVQATADIAAAASGPGVRITASGAAEAVTMVNRSTITWSTGVFGYAFPRAGDCVYDAIPSCC